MQCNVIFSMCMRCRVYDRVCDIKYRVCGIEYDNQFHTSV